VQIKDILTLEKIPQLLSLDLHKMQEENGVVRLLTAGKFDALTTSITEGLPREIELRQKQYEYYRSQLLNFEK